MIYLYLWSEVEWKWLSHVWLFATPWAIQSMEFSGPEYWSGSPFLSPRDIPNPGTEPSPLTLRADSLLPEPQGRPRITACPINSSLKSMTKIKKLLVHTKICRQVHSSFIHHKQNNLYLCEGGNNSNVYELMMDKWTVAYLGNLMLIINKM